MKLHLPKVLFTAVVAAVCCVQQAMADPTKSNLELNGTAYTLISGDSNTGMTASNIAPEAGTILAFGMHTDIETGQAPAQGAGNWFSGSQTYSNEIYIYDDDLEDAVKKGLVISNGNPGNEITFAGAVSGNGVISMPTTAPVNGLTLKFTGNMSAYTGNIEMLGQANNKLVFDGATTGTGSIDSIGTVSMTNVTVNNRSINTTKTITLDGATVNSAVEMSATEGIILQSGLDTSSENAALTIAGTTVNITLADVLAGKFNGSVGYDQGGGVTSRDANGKLRLKDFSAFSNADKVTLKDGSATSIAGTDITYTSSSVTATYGSVYGIAVDTVYSSSSDIMNAGVLILDNSATLTLDAPTWTSSNGEKAFHVVGANTGIKLSGETATLKETDLTVLSGGNVTISGDGVFTVADKQLGSGIAIDGTTWTGTVKYTGSASDNNLVTNLAKLGNANSTIELTGAGGHLAFQSGVLANQHLELKDNGDIKALTILDGSSAADHNVSRSYLAAKITGNGTLVYAFKGSYSDRPISAINFEGDISGWNGRFVYSNSDITATNEVDVYFTAKATEINAAISNDSAGKLNLIVDNADKTTTFNNTVNATSVSTTARSSVKLGKGGDMTTDSFSLGEDGTLTLAGGTLTVTNSITLSTVTVDFSQYFDASKLVDKTYSVDLVTAGEITDWAGAQTGTYTADGTEYTTTVDQNGNSIVLTFKGPDDVVEPGSLTVDSAMLTGDVLTLNINANLTDVSSVDLMLSEAALADIKGMSGLVSLSLVAADGTFTTVETDGATLINNVTFYNGAYAGEGDGKYQIAYIPEPATATLSLLALAGLAARRRR